MRIDGFKATAFKLHYSDALKSEGADVRQLIGASLFLFLCLLALGLLAFPSVFESIMRRVEGSARKSIGAPTTLLRDEVPSFQTLEH